MYFMGVNKRVIQFHCCTCSIAIYSEKVKRVHFNRKVHCLEVIRMEERVLRQNGAPHRPPSADRGAFCTPQLP